MTDRSTSRWPTVTGLWLGLATWLYAALAAYEVWDMTRNRMWVDEVGVSRSPALAEALVDWTAVALGLALVVAAVSLVTGRARRIADLVLAAGLGLGAVLLWAAEHPRPAAPVAVGVVAAVLAMSALLPERPAEGRLAGFLGRLVLATSALLLGWLCAHEIAERHWQFFLSIPDVYWPGLVIAALMLFAALLGPLLGRPVLRWIFGLPTLLVGLGVLALGGLLLREGYLLTGYEEVERGWDLGGAPAYLGAGLSAAGLALLCRRPTLAVGTVSAAVLTLLAILVGIPEIRNNV
jgi:Ca2+/Na+ antiporter